MGYDRWSRIYDTEDNPLIKLEARYIDRLVGDVRGLKLTEHAVDGQLAAESQRAGRYLGWPLLLMMQLKPATRRVS